MERSCFFFFSSRRRHTRWNCDWSSDVCSSDLIADAAFSLPSGEISQPVQGRFGVAVVKIDKIEPGVEPSYESVASDLKKEVAMERARKSVADLRDKMEDERGGGASVIEAAQKLGLAAVTIDAVDRSGRLPNGQLVANIP